MNGPLEYAAAATTAAAALLYGVLTIRPGTSTVRAILYALAAGGLVMLLGYLIQ